MKDKYIIYGTYILVQQHVKVAYFVDTVRYFWQSRKKYLVDMSATMSFRLFRGRPLSSFSNID